MARVYVSIGSNIDRERHVCAALDALSQNGKNLRVSSVYESEAVGFDGAPFYNLVAGFDTDWPLADLNCWLKQIEDSNGRDRTHPKFSARTLDIDVLLYDDLVGECDGIQLPRPEITENAFVLRPLAEIAPDLKHPVLEQDYGSLWRAYQRNQKLWPVNFDWAGQRISCSD